MKVALRNRFVTLIAAAATALTLSAVAGPGNPPAPGAGPDSAAVQTAPDAAAQAAAASYWTAARMSATLRAAIQPLALGRPLVRDRTLVRKSLQAAGPAAYWLAGNTAGHGLRWTHGGAVTDAVGKVFFSLGGANYVCSGTLVSGDVVLTAAHCVSGGPGKHGGAQWATHWLFVPGYSNNSMPYGEYTASRLLVEPAWTGPQGGSEQYDVAFVRVKPYGATRGARLPAGLPLQFAGSQDAAVASRAYLFGYPSEPPYTGLFPNYCAGKVTTAGGSARLACGMTAGDSGGPWLAGFSPGTGTGSVFAVSTYKLSSNLGMLYGAVLGPQARALYERALSPAG